MNVATCLWICLVLKQKHYWYNKKKWKNWVMFTQSNLNSISTALPCSFSGATWHIFVLPTTEQIVSTAKISCIIVRFLSTCSLYLQCRFVSNRYCCFFGHFSEKRSICVDQRLKSGERNFRWKHLYPLGSFVLCVEKR